MSWWLLPTNLWLSFDVKCYPSKQIRNFNYVWVLHDFIVLQMLVKSRSETKIWKLSVHSCLVQHLTLIRSGVFQSVCIFLHKLMLTGLRKLNISGGASVKLTTEDSSFHKMPIITEGRKMMIPKLFSLAKKWLEIENTNWLWALEVTKIILLYITLWQVNQWLVIWKANPGVNQISK